MVEVNNMARYICIAEHYNTKKQTALPGKSATLDKARWRVMFYQRDFPDCAFLIFNDESKKFVGEMHHDTYGDFYYYPAHQGKYKVAPSGRLGKKLR